MATEKATVLFVHGSWHQPSHFARIRKVFEAEGYPTSCPLHPSVGSKPPIGLMEDAQCIRDELSRLINEQGKDVIVVAHSYGGVVTTQAVDEAFAKSKRAAAGNKGGVLHLLYMCAFILKNNLSLAGAFGGTLPPFILVDDEGMCHPEPAGALFYQDLPPDEQQHWVSELKHCPVIAQQTPLTQTAYLYHPTTYLYCTEDAALPYAVQQLMVKNVSNATGIKIETESCAASHSPFLSMPEKVLQVVQKIDAAAAA